MGILLEDEAADIDALTRIFDASIESWNSKYAGREGVLLGINKDGIEAASHLGGKILHDCFPDSPDSFKRVAASIVMMSINPFIIGRAGNDDGMYVTVLQGDELRSFAIRFVIDSLPLLFSPLDQVYDDGKIMPMNWPGFFSEDLRDEFIEYINTLSTSEIVEWKNRALVYNKTRLARTILAVSLTLKSLYGRFPE